MDTLVIAQGCSMEQAISLATTHSFPLVLGDVYGTADDEARYNYDNLYSILYDYWNHTYNKGRNTWSVDRYTNIVEHQFVQDVIYTKLMRRH